MTKDIGFGFGFRPLRLDLPWVSVAGRACRVRGSTWLAGGLVGLLALGGGLAPHAFGQSPVWTVPQPATSASGQASGTIASTGVWQKVFGATPLSPGGSASGGGTRHGCTIINNATTRTMNLIEGYTIGTATLGNSVTLAAGQAYYCNWNGTVLVGEVDIQGTLGDAFYATQY